MLERTAGCLESGPLRRFLPGSKKALKSRRMLHSAFWNHGAGELEISPIWEALVRGHEVADDQENKASKHSGANSSGLFLDFLYPSGAGKLIRQCSSWGSERQDSRRTVAGIARFGHRLYTSLAKDIRNFSPDLDNNKFQIPRSQSYVEEDTKKHTPGDPSPATCPEMSLEELLGITQANDYEEAWRQYGLREEDQRIEYGPQLIKYLSKSSREIDALRALAIFSKLKHYAGVEGYQSALRSALQVGDIAQAVNIHQEIIAKFKVPLGSDILLAFLLNHGSWELAYEAWERFQIRNKRRKFEYNVWETLDASSNIQKTAIELAKYAYDELNEASKTSPTTGSEMSRFVSQVVVRALVPKSKESDFQTSDSRRLLDILIQLGADTPQIYERSIEDLVKLKKPKLAMRFYRRYRQRTTSKISRKTLYTALNISCQNHSTLGIQHVLDDWVRFYGSPPRQAIRLCLREYSAQGDARTVKALFEQYFSKLAEGGDIATDIAPLLHVHAIRGELLEVVNIFDNMETVYGVKPNLRCWNILLNAYGKDHDVEGAFARFEQLMEVGLQPDEYTFGTMMATCVARGDLAEVMELYQMAEGLGVKRSIPMIDCIVLGHLQNGELSQAERICEDALTMKLNGPLTRMWNYLLTTYAMRRDLENLNRILRRMKDASIDYDEMTYAALMQALAMVKQPERAFQILKYVMPEAGIEATAFHYAIAMGAFLATNETKRIFQLHKKMLDLGIRDTVSTRLMMIKAGAVEDQRENISDGKELSRANKLFYEAFTNSERQEFVDPKRKGVGRHGINAAFSSVYYEFLIFVCGQRGAFNLVKELFSQYKENAPETRRDEVPIKILNALIACQFKEANHEGVQMCWDMAFSQAKKSGLPIRTVESSTAVKVLPLHRLALTKPLQVQIRSLALQEKFPQLLQTIKDVEAAGFELDNIVWNTYVQLLTRSHRHQQAFELCEEKLIDGWTGWARIRWQERRRNRLPLEIQYLKRDKRYLRPTYHTLLYLARAMLDLEQATVESREAEMMLKALEKKCSRTLHAVRTMQRTDDDLEREVMLY